jgi:hypothetical protein
VTHKQRPHKPLACQPESLHPLAKAQLAPETAAIARRAQEIAMLASKDEIHEADIDGLDITTLFTIADAHYSHCSPSVKKILRQHSHSAIRNAAYLSEGGAL